MPLFVTPYQLRQGFLVLLLLCLPKLLLGLTMQISEVFSSHRRTKQEFGGAFFVLEGFFSRPFLASLTDTAPQGVEGCKRRRARLVVRTCRTTRYGGAKQRRLVFAQVVDIPSFFLGGGAFGPSFFGGAKGPSWPFFWGEPFGPFLAPIFIFL
jgi:hypothetical protein